MNVFTYAIIAVPLLFQLTLAQTRVDTTISQPTTPAVSSPPSSDTTNNSVKKTDSLKQSTTQVDGAKTEKKAPIIEESEEELILDGGEETLIPADAKIEQVKSESVIGKDSLQTNASDSLKKPDSSLVQDTLSPKNHFVSPINVAPEEKVALKIEETQSMNFAKNMKEYRSPKIAMLLSLLVPGTGQVYAKNYTKAGIFGAVEVALITVGSVLGYQGAKKWEKAEKFADEHYKLSEFEKYAEKLSGAISDTGLKRTIYFPDTTPSAFIKDAKAKNDDFYESIRSATNPYVHGWDDVTPKFTSGFDIDVQENEPGTYVQDNDTLYLIYQVNSDGDTVPKNSQFGFSENQKKYNDKIVDANTTYRWSGSVFTMLLVSHIASAVDAGITAKAYNDQLIGRKSAWQRINIKETLVSTPVEKASGLALEVRF